MPIPNGKGSNGPPWASKEGGSLASVPDMKAPAWFREKVQREMALLRSPQGTGNFITKDTKHTKEEAAQQMHVRVGVQPGLVALDIGGDFILEMTPKQALAVARSLRRNAQQAKELKWAERRAAGKPDRVIEDELGEEEEISEGEGNGDAEG